MIEFNESILNKTSIVDFNNAQEYVTIDSCKAYSHDLIRQIHSLEFLLGFMVVIALFWFWKTGRIQDDFKRLKAWIDKKE